MLASSFPENKIRLPGIGSALVIDLAQVSLMDIFSTNAKSAWSAKKTWITSPELEAFLAM